MTGPAIRDSADIRPGVEFDYYERDQAVFRGPPGAKFVNEVCHQGRWSTYDGDRRKPVVLGDFLGTRTERAEDS